MSARGLSTRRPPAIALTAVLGALVVASPVAHASKKQKKTLSKGVKLYQDASYEEALFVLEELAARPKIDRGLEAQALKHVAFCYFLLGATDQAKDAWLRLRKVAPKLELNPASESPEIIDFFAKLDAAEGTSSGGEADETKDGAPDGKSDGGKSKDNWQKAPPPQDDARGCGIILCLLPAGTGQFANGRIIKGVIFAILEPLFLGLNIAFWYMNDTDRVSQPIGPDRFRDIALANERYTYQMVFFGVTVGTVVIGILDAFLFY